MASQASFVRPVLLTIAVVVLLVLTHHSHALSCHENMLARYGMKHNYNYGNSNNWRSSNAQDGRNLGPTRTPTPSQSLSSSPSLNKAWTVTPSPSLSPSSFPSVSISTSPSVSYSSSASASALVSFFSSPSPSASATASSSSSPSPSVSMSMSSSAYLTLSASATASSSSSPSPSPSVSMSMSSSVSPTLSATASTSFSPSSSSSVSAYVPVSVSSSPSTSISSTAHTTATATATASPSNSNSTPFLSPVLPPRNPNLNPIPNATPKPLHAGCLRLFSGDVISLTTYTAISSGRSPGSSFSSLPFHDSSTFQSSDSSIGSWFQDGRGSASISSQNFAVHITNAKARILTLQSVSTEQYLSTMAGNNNANGDGDGNTQTIVVTLSDTPSQFRVYAYSTASPTMVRLQDVKSGQFIVFISKYDSNDDDDDDDDDDVNDNNSYEKSPNNIIEYSNNLAVGQPVDFEISMVSASKKYARGIVISSCVVLHDGDTIALRSARHTYFKTTNVIMHSSFPGYTHDDEINFKILAAQQSLVNEDTKLTVRMLDSGHVALRTSDGSYLTAFCCWRGQQVVTVSNVDDSGLNWNNNDREHNTVRFTFVKVQYQYVYLKTEDGLFLSLLSADEQVDGDSGNDMDGVAVLREEADSRLSQVKVRFV